MSDWLKENEKQTAIDKKRLETAGELYSLLADIASESGDEYWEYEGGGRTHERAVFEVLEEAKADFPYVENYVDTEDDEERHNKINAWFKKWFGSK